MLTILPGLVPGLFYVDPKILSNKTGDAVPPELAASAISSRSFDTATAYEIALRPSRWRASR
jgi:hypothetical protein